MSSAETDAFVWEQTLRGLDRQATVLSELRQRASIVLSATGITTSLLGATALQDGGLDVWVVAALAVTTIGILLCVWVLKPVRDTGEGREWRVTVGGEELRGLLQGELQLPDVRHADHGANEQLRHHRRAVEALRRVVCAAPGADRLLGRSARLSGP
jgi:hypothetical protein